MLPTAPKQAAPPLTVGDVSAADVLETEADNYYGKALEAARRSDYAEAGYLLSRHDNRLQRARALAPVQ